MISISVEQSCHYDSVQQLTVSAFEASKFGHQGESELIEALRDICERAISLVALDDRKVIGHVIASPAVIHFAGSERSGLAIGPMAVMPSFQRRGVGSQLVRAVVERADAAGESFMAVVGHPEFYTRFGFRPILDFGVQHCFEGMPDDVFFLRGLQTTFPDHFENGRLVYSNAFGRQDRFA
ncbi:GNAT family N-acetyltransferase [Rhodopirellula baltica]|uniref:GNAT family N-acetyltransferase n=1 Tax=Rhodopirellula baltica TaxID=265606 RepID=UPI001F1A2FEB|nr:N-acetyltransferase [Rhodopirellula baltica]